MAKGIGLIGNFRGKVGNMVGYNLKDSNNKQTQGVRVYQPIVKNPKTYAQAEQRAKLLAVNATYRALKEVIDRGQEGLAYGNKSRLAWLKGALKEETMPWFVKGSIPEYLVGAPLTKGSLPSLTFTAQAEFINITAEDVTNETDVSTVGKLSTVLFGAYPFLKEGDQITIVGVFKVSNGLVATVDSIVLDSVSTAQQSLLTAGAGTLTHELSDIQQGCAVIVSREGDSGQHLRSSEIIYISADIRDVGPYDDASKEAAIRSYMAAGSNTDWAEESLQ